MDTNLNTRRYENYPGRVLKVSDGEAVVVKRITGKKFQTEIKTEVLATEYEKLQGERDSLKELLNLICTSLNLKQDFIFTADKKKEAFRFLYDLVDAKYYKDEVPYSVKKIFDFLNTEDE